MNTWSKTTMKTILLNTVRVSVALVSLGAVTGCGAASRTPAQYAEETQKAFAEQDGAMKSCYETVLASKPDAKGDVTIKFEWTVINGADERYPTLGNNVTIGTNSKDMKGKVSVSSSTAPEEVTKCVTDNVVNARLKPAGDGTGIATWTFHFAPTGAAAPAADAPKS